MKRLSVIVFCTIILLTACAPATPAAPTLRINPRTCKLDPGSSLPLFLTYISLPEDGSFRWSASRGSVNPATGTQVVYTAPLEPGIDIISVEYQFRDETYSEILICGINNLDPKNAASSTPIVGVQTIIAQQTIDASMSDKYTPTVTALPSKTPIPVITAQGTQATLTPSPTQIQAMGVPSTLTPSPYVKDAIITSTPELITLSSTSSDTFTAQIAFNKPERMMLDQTTIVDLVINPSLLQPTLAAVLAKNEALVTSTADPKLYLDPSNAPYLIETSEIDSTPRLKAVLIARDPEAFTIVDIHESAEQPVSMTDTTTWRWSVTARKPGSQSLELILYQLVPFEGKDYWRDVETYRATIVVQITLMDILKEVDWKWVLGFVIAAVGAVLGVLKYVNDTKKSGQTVSSTKTSSKKTSAEKKKK